MAISQRRLKTVWPGLLAAAIACGGCAAGEDAAPAKSSSASGAASDTAAPGVGGIVTYPLEAAARAKLNLSLAQVKHALDLYKAEHGAGPKSQAEFEKLILEPNRIQLPKGRRLLYEPRTGEVTLDPPE